MPECFNADAALHRDANKFGQWTLIMHICQTK
jgi:hypothetical protein